MFFRKWSTVDLQCCANFCHKTKCFSHLSIYTQTHTHTDTHSHIRPFPLWLIPGFPGDPVVKNLPAMQEMPVWLLGQEDLLEKEMSIPTSILAWKILGTEEPCGLQSMGWQRVGLDLLTQQQQQMAYHRILNIIPDAKESDMTERLNGCYTARPRLFSHILYTLVCICSPQSPSLSLLHPQAPGKHQYVLRTHDSASASRTRSFMSYFRFHI